MPEPWYTDEQITLWHGDALDVSRELASGSVDCIVTSPPYFGLRDYGVDDQYGLESSPSLYVARLRRLFSELHRVLADDGTLWLNIGDSYSRGARGAIGGKQTNTSGQGYTDTETWNLRKAANGGANSYGLSEKNLLGIPWRVAFALQDDGWILRNAIIWSKPNAMPESVTDRLSNRYEHIFLFSKSSKYWFDLDPIRESHTRIAKGPKVAEWVTSTPWNHNRLGEVGCHKNGRNPGDVWELATKPCPEAHFAVFPPQLPQRCIAAGCAPKRCQECGHVPERIIEKADRQVLREKYAHRVDTALGSDWKALGKITYSGQEYVRWRADNPDKTVGWTDCGHNAYRGSTVLDPFSGIGTTGMAAQQLGRRYVGIDLNADYLELSLNTRLRQQTLDFGA